MTARGERAARADADARRHVFRSMGTTVRLIAPDGPAFRGRGRRGRGDVLPAERPLHAVHARQRAVAGERPRRERGRRSPRSSATMTVLALDAAARTDGLFDPTVLPALLAAGYDRDFDELIAGARLALHPPVPCGRWRRGAGPRETTSCCRLGWRSTSGASPRAERRTSRRRKRPRRLPWALVDAGGDLRLAGEDVPSEGVEIAVEDPYDASAELLRLRMTGGGLATSSVTARAWGPGTPPPDRPAHRRSRRRPGSSRRPSGRRRARRPRWARSGRCWRATTSLGRLPAILVRDDLRVDVGMSEAG